jgi:hypothetical protein
MQVEWQTGSEWLICSFPYTDFSKVTDCLGHLKSLQKNYTDPEDNPKLFSSLDYSLKFNGQAAPFKKGQKTRPGLTSS